jgi:putative ABC transport system ATP-binding protein
MYLSETVRTRTLLRAQGLRKHYRVGHSTVTALASIDLEIYPGEYLAISGPSGCGKSTLLAMLGALDRPTAGKVFIGKLDLSKLNDDGLSEMRSRIGFVFQFFNLIHSLNTRENVELGLSVNNVSRAVRRERAENMLELVGLHDRMDHRPYELSGGERQRVAIARALARDPKYLLMDEPTGNLDSNSVIEILDLIRELNYRGTTIVMVTHAPNVALHAKRQISMLDGRIVSPSPRSEVEDQGNRDVPH